MKTSRIEAVLALAALFGLFAQAVQAQNFGDPPSGSGPLIFTYRQPLGIYVRDTSSCTLVGSQTIKDCLTAKAMTLLSNPAVSGINPELDWSDLNSSFGVYDWSELDAVFDAVDAWNSANPAKRRKTVQIDVNPGFHSPQWVFDGMSSCDPMFASVSEADAQGNLNPAWLLSTYNQPNRSLVPQDCGYATFQESEQHNSKPYLPLPLPWSPFYQYAWATFVHALAQRYGDNPDLVSVTMAGPTASSAEMILPDEKSDTGDPLDFYKWNYLILLTFPSSYQNSDRAFIEAWYDTVDLYSREFSGLTLVITSGSGLPNFLMGPNAGVIGTAQQTGTPYPNYSVPPGFEPDCANPDMTKIMDCAAEASVEAYFANPLHGGFNLKSAQSNGLGAAGVFVGPLGGGDLDAHGIKWLAAASAGGITRLPGTYTFLSKVFGGQQSGGDITGFGSANFQADIQAQGCNIPNSLGGCQTLTAEQAAYNFMAAYFDTTGVGAYYGPGFTTPSPPYGPNGVVSGPVPLNYLQLYDVDILYANANACDIPGGACLKVQVTNGAGQPLLVTFQDVLEMAARQISQIADSTFAGWSGGLITDQP